MKTPTTMPAKHLAISIAKTPAEVYAFAGNPENLPKWAAGLAKSEVKKSGSEWEAEGPLGKVKIKWTPKNELGVMDHEVTAAKGPPVLVPLRVMPNGKGSEVVFTLYRLPGVTDAQLAKDTALVESDLRKLKAVLEK